jgi:DNA-binding transcriptional regulator of glucitol operon
MVCVQGFAGGFWVNTAHLGYIVFHGVFGQLVLAVYVALAAMAHPAWWQVEPLSHRAAGTDRTLNVLLLVLVLGQTAMGVVLRKTDEMLVLHIVGAVVVAMAALIVGLRGWGIYGQAIAGLRRTGLWLTGVLAAQLVLGLVALVVRGPAERPIVVGSPAVSEANDAALTTLHQAGGALLLCLVMLHLVLVFRRLKPAAAAAGQPLPASPATTPTAPREVSREPTPA